MGQIIFTKRLYDRESRREYIYFTYTIEAYDYDLEKKRNSLFEEKFLVQISNNLIILFRE